MTSGKLRKLRRVYLGEMAAVTSINYRAWISREAPDPSLLVNLSANSVRLYRLVKIILLGPIFTQSILKKYRT